MNALTIHEAAQTTGWSARMLRYVERTGLIQTNRSPAGYRLYGAAQLQRLRTLKELLQRFDLGLSEVAFAARLQADPELHEAIGGWLNAEPQRPDPRDPTLWPQREALKAAMQYPALAGPVFDALTVESFTQPGYAAVRVAIVRGDHDKYRYADSALIAAGGDRIHTYIVPFASHSLKRIIVARPVMRQALDWLLEPAAARAPGTGRSCGARSLDNDRARTTRSIEQRSDEIQPTPSLDPFAIVDFRQVDRGEDCGRL